MFPIEQGTHLVILSLLISNVVTVYLSTTTTEQLLIGGFNNTKLDYFS